MISYFINNKFIKLLIIIYLKYETFYFTTTFLL